MPVIDDNGNRYVPKTGKNGKTTFVPTNPQPVSYTPYKMPQSSFGLGGSSGASSSGSSSNPSSEERGGRAQDNSSSYNSSVSRADRYQNQANAHPMGDKDGDNIANKFDSNDALKNRNTNSKDFKKQQAWNASNIPNGDVDGDGLRNNIDPNNNKKNVINGQSKTKIVHEKVVLGSSSSVFNNNTLSIPLEVKEELKRIEAEDKKSYAVQQDPFSKQWYIVRSVEKENKKYDKKLDADGSGTSGTLADYKILSEKKAKKQRVDGRDSGSKKPESSVSGGSSLSSGGGGANNGSQGGSDGGNSSSSGSNQNSGQQNNSSKSNLGGNKNKKQRNNNGPGGGSNSNKEQDVVAGLYGNGNVNNIKRRLANAYGTGSTNKVTFDEIVTKFRAEHGEKSVDLRGTPGSYNYNAVFTIDGKQTDDLAVITKATKKYLVDGGGSTDVKDLKDEKLNYLTPNSAKVVANRFGRAFGGGDAVKGQEALNQALDSLKATSPGKVRVNGTPGSAGYSIEVKANGEWSNKSKDIAMVLGKHVPGADVEVKNRQPVLAKNTANILAGAYGKGVTDRFLSMYGPENYNKKLDSALAKFEKDGGKVKEHGVRGQNGYYIELVTKNGNGGGNHIVETDKIMNRLEKYTKDRLATPYVKPAADALAPATGGVPTSGVNPTPGNDVGKQTPFLPSGVPNSWGNGGFSKPDKNNPLFDEWTAVNSAFKKLEFEKKNLQPSGNSPADVASYQQAHAQLQLALQKYDKASGGAIANANDSPVHTNVMPRPVYDKQDGVADSAPIGSQIEQARDTLRNGNVNQEPNKQKDLNGKLVEVNISEAAKKSQQIMAVDLNDNGKVSQKEASILAPADANNNGVIGVKEVKAFVPVADIDKSGQVSRVESKAFNAVDKNDDGEISRREAKKALQAQIDNKKDQREHDLAKEYLAKSNTNSGGNEQVNEQAVALVNAQPKHDNKPKDDGPGKKKKNK